MDDFKAALPSFVKKIVNKNQEGGPSTSISSSTSSTSRLRSNSRHSTSLFSRNASLSVASSRYSTGTSSLRRASKVAEGLAGSGLGVAAPTASLLNITKLKEKVAQGGSRVMASLKSDPVPSSSRSSSISSTSGIGAAMAASAVAAVAATAAATASSRRESSGGPSSSGALSSSSYQNRNQEASAIRAKLTGQSSLTNEQLTAHLTDEERNILEKVFLKEEEFHRESGLKSTSLNINKQLRRFSTRCLNNDGAGQKAMELASPLESPSSSSCASGGPSPLLLGCCRVCRKNIEVGEKHHFCDTCSQPVCEDCSSYSDIRDGEIWMCNVCRRRRGTFAAPEGSSIPGASLGGDLQKRRLSAMRRTSVADVGLRNENAFENMGGTRQHRPAERHDSDGAKDYLMQQQQQAYNMHNRRYSHYSPRERPRTASPPEYSNLSGLERHSADSTRTYDSNASTTSTNYSRRHSPSSETLSHRSSSEPRSETLGAGYGGGMSGRSSGSRKSLTASESSLEEYYPLSELDMMTSPNISPNSQRKPKIPRQKKSLPSEERVSGVEQPTYTGVFPDSCHPPHGGMRSLPPVASSLLNIDGRSGSAGGCSSTHHHSSHHLHSSSSTLRHISSDATIHFDFSPAASPQRRRSDSPLSEYSDIRISSPPGDSMSPCSPEYNRSPRQSGDSDLLNVNLPSIGQPSSQRRSIPSVLVDPATDINYLSLKECFPRRSSTGRALPKIPIEQSRSLLDLPAKSNGSTHSLDLPHDQPRRASAPEGENIRIVIDDVDSATAGYRNRDCRIERVILHRDHNDRNPRTRGFGLYVTGGKLNDFDGRLYAYVSWVIPSSPADKMGLKPGDKILEWDAKCLINCTYEQVVSIMDSSATSAELIIEPLNREERKGSFFHQKRRLSSQVSLEQRTFDFNPITSGQHQGHQHQANQHIANVPAINEMGTSFSDSTGIINPLPPSSPSVSSRRRLPKLPTAGSTSTVPQPEILIEFFLDVDRQELMVTIVSARGFTPPSTSYTFVMAQVLPAVREGFKACRTQFSSNLEWNETIIFQPIPVDDIIDMALEVSLWESEGSSSSAESLLGETLVPLANVCTNASDWWPLLMTSYYPTQDFNNLLQPNNNHACLKENIGGSRSVPSSRRNSGRIESSSPILSQTGSRGSLDDSTMALRSRGLREQRHSAIDISHFDQGSTAGLPVPPEYLNIRRKSSSAAVTAAGVQLNRFMT